VGVVWTGLDDLLEREDGRAGGGGDGDAARAAAPIARRHSQGHAILAGRRTRNYEPWDQAKLRTCLRCAARDDPGVAEADRDALAEEEGWCADAAGFLRL